MVSSYPVQFDVDFPGRSLDRLTTAFRIIVAIPILVLLIVLTRDTVQGGQDMTFTLAGGGQRTR